MRCSRILLLLACAALPALAASERKGIGYFDAQDYPRAITELQPLAEAGGATSQYYLAMSQRAQQRRDLGQIRLVPVPQDARQQQSHGWFGQAAAQGHAEAMVEYAVDFEEGFGVEVDYTLALDWMRKARDAGARRALSYLQDWYRSGYIVKPDAVRADELLAEMEATRPRGAGSTAQQRENEARALRAARIALASRPAQEDIDAAAAGNPEAALRLARLATDSGRETPDCAAADRWYRRAGELGLGDAFYELGLLLYRGACGQDIARARELFEAAAKAGNPQATHELAGMYLFGHLGSPDYPLAYQYEQLYWSLSSVEAPPGPLSFARRHMSAQQLAAADAEVARLRPELFALKERRTRGTTVRQVALGGPPAGAQWSSSLTLTDVSGACARNYLQQCDYVPFQAVLGISNASDSTLACSLRLAVEPFDSAGPSAVERRIVLLPGASRSQAIGNLAGSVDAGRSSLGCTVVTQPSVADGTCAMQLPPGAAPTYPAAARRRGQSGLVRVEFLVQETATRPAQVAIVASSGVDALDNAAVEFLTSTVIHTNCPGVLMTAPVDFRLQD